MPRKPHPTALRPRLLRTLHAATVVVCLMASLAACAVAGGSSLTLGEPMPAFELANLAGGTLASEDLRGAVTVINFWATWCGPCRREIPALREIGQVARVIGISLDDAGEQGAVRQFIAGENIDYTVLQGTRALTSQFGIRSIPFTLILDPQLNVTATYRGVVRQRRLRKAIQRASRAGLGKLEPAHSDSREGSPT